MIVFTLFVYIISCRALLKTKPLLALKVAPTKAASNNECTPLRVHQSGCTKPRMACNQADLLQALNPCLPASNYHLRHNERGLVLVFNQSGQREYGLGYHLAQYFQARAVALLADLSFEAMPPFHYMGFYLPRFVPGPIAQQYDNVLNVAHYCTMCPSRRVDGRWFHQCVGAWIALDIGKELRNAVEHQVPPWDCYEVVIQFSCRGMHKTSRRELLPFSYYQEILSQNFTYLTNPTIAIVADYERSRDEFCLAAEVALAVALEHALRVPIKVISPKHVLQQLAMMMDAQLFVSGVSPLGLWAGIANAGNAYLPVHDVMAGSQKPCVGNVRWVQTRVHSCESEGCTPKTIPDWFVTDQKLRNLITSSIDRFLVVAKEKASLSNNTIA